MKYFPLFFSCALLMATSAECAPTRVSLKEAIVHGLMSNAELRAQRFQERQAQSDERLVYGEFGPKIDGLAAVAPIPGATGNSASSSSDMGAWGRMAIAKLQFTQAIYTWGRKSDYVAAAEKGILVKQGDSQKKEVDVRYDIKEAYYGCLYAHSLLDFIIDGKKDLQKAFEENNTKKHSSKKENYRLEIFLKQIDEREAEVRKSYSLAHAGLALRSGWNEDVAPVEDWISAKEHTLEPVNYYVSQARVNRVEFSQLNNGISAKRSLARAEKRGLLPVLGFGMNYDAAKTNVRPSQPGPYAYDPYNHWSISVGLGLKLDFAWDIQMAKAEKYEAEAEELEAKGTYAEQGIALEVRKAYWEVEEAEKRLKAAGDAYKLGKKWLSGETISYSAGLGKVQDLVEAYGGRAETVKNYYEAIFKQHLAWAALSKAVGRELETNLQ